MAQLQSTLKLTLLDQVSARAKVISRSLDGISKHTNGLMAMSRNIAAFAATYIGVTEGIDRTYSAAQKMESSLAEIGIKAGLTNDGLQAMQRNLTALSPKVNQTTTDLLSGVDAMVTLGLATDKAMDSIPAIAKAATATGASIADLSAASTSAIQNMDVLPSEITKMLDAMALAGNAGAFELKDMAQYFPQLTASAKTLGIDGVDGVADLAAALQIARRGSSDASTAANNLSDFMAKIVTPQTIKNFKKFGVNVTKELQTAHKKGISPIEHFIKLLDEKTQGGKGELLTQIFGDKQTLDFIRPMIADFKDYVRIREEAERATGTVDSAFAKRMQTNAEKVKSLKIAFDNLGTSIGANLLTPVGDFAKHLSDIFNTLGERVTVFDRIGTSLEGFFHGLGFDGGKAFADAMKSIDEFLFGVKDGSKAADEMGGIFAKFEGYGKSIKQFGLDAKQGLTNFETSLGLEPGTILKTLEKIGGLGLKLAIAGVGIGIAAGAIKGLAGALYWLSGASTAVGILKTIAELSSKLSTGTTAGALSTAATTTGTAFGTAFAVAAGAAIAAGLLVTLRELDPAGNLGGLTKPVDDFIKKHTGWDPAKDGLTPGNVLDGLDKFLPFKAGIQTLKDLAFPTVDPKQSSRRADPGGYDMAGRHAYINSPAGVAADAAARATAPQQQSRSVTIDQSSIAAMVRPSGVQQVQEVNKQRPVVNVNVGGISITGIADLASAASSAASQLGQKVKTAVESTHTD